MRKPTLAILLAGGLVAGPLVTPASAVTVEELFSLKANGLSDDILVALIETDGSVFRLAPDDVVILYRRGLSERVILAMIATARREAPIETDIQPVPIVQVPPTIVQPVQVVHASPTVEVEVPVAVPVAVPVYVPVDRHPRKPDTDNRRDSQVYWGYGGHLRPDAWGQPRQREPERPPARGSDKGDDKKDDKRGSDPPARRR